MRDGEVFLAAKTSNTTNATSVYIPQVYKSKTKNAFIQDTKKLIKQTMKMFMMLNLMNFVSFVAGDSLG